MVKPIFIFCLVRSGSTLLQRVLMSHSKISSAAEPHLLLPFVYSTKIEGTLASYSHIASQRAIEDTINSLQGGSEEYYTYLREFCLKIYNSLSSEESIYFVDKTPRYSSIIHDIQKIFPNGKFVFLFRNPVQIYASILETFGNKRFHKIHGFYGHLTRDFEALSFQKRDFKSEFHSLQYVDLVSNPKETITQLVDFLDLDFEDSMLTLFENQKIDGRSKDPTGIKRYSSIEISPLEKWKMLFNTRYRKRIISKYINNLSTESLESQGYIKKEMLEDIKKIDSSGNYSVVTDFIDLVKLKLKLRFKLNILFAKNMDWTKGQYLN